MSTQLPAGPFSQAPINREFEGHRVRFVGTAEKPEWVAQDVCDVIGLENVSRLLSDFDPDEKGIREVHTLRGKQNLLTVYEPGLYKLLFKQTRKPEVKRFQKWVFSEVLPSLRRYGVYPPPENFSYQLTLKPYTARVVWVMQVRRKLPPGYWCVFIEGAEILIGAEHIFGPADLEMKQYDLLDGSIGMRWSAFRQDKPWMGRRVPYEYTFPSGDPRGTVRPWAYPMQELEHFKVWLHGEYWTQHFPDYVKRKYGSAQFQKALPIFIQLGVPLLSYKDKKK
ncbi:MAG TPA: Bro-N domain-containing protein [Gemmataceae bacterium]|nr:Bro-N domain-containing protein [Gemmataceae bacterium]